VLALLFLLLILGGVAIWIDVIWEVIEKLE
jgi:hypothetical protein